MTLDIDIKCDCGEALDWERHDETNLVDFYLEIKPCEKCAMRARADAKDEGYDWGLKDGRAEGARERE